MAAAARFGTLWCPHWPVVAAGITGGGPVVVLQANRVVAHDDAAAERGVRVGMRRREAQAACPEAQVAAADPAREAREFESVAPGRRRARPPAGGHRAGLDRLRRPRPVALLRWRRGDGGGVAPHRQLGCASRRRQCAGLRRRHRRRPVHRRGGSAAAPCASALPWWCRPRDRPSSSPRCRCACFGRRRPRRPVRRPADAPRPAPPRRRRRPPGG